MLVIIRIQKKKKKKMSGSKYLFRLLWEKRRAVAIVIADLLHRKYGKFSRTCVLDLGRIHSPLLKLAFPQYVYPHIIIIIDKSILNT